MASMTGKTAIITGASRGIGEATARAMAAEGANLLLLARNGGSLTDLAQELSGKGGRVEAMTCDVSEYSQVETAVSRARGLFEKVDIMVNNAAVIDPIGPLSTSTPKEWHKAISINLGGMYNGTRAVLPQMRRQGAGVIVNISSGAAHNPIEGWSAYCSSKAAAFMLTRCTHLENRGAGVRAMSLSPGTVATDMQRQIKASGINAVSRMEFSDHAPVEIPAQAIIWLTGDDAKDLAGEEVSLRDPEIRARIGLDQPA